VRKQNGASSPFCFEGLALSNLLEFLPLAAAVILALTLPQVAATLPATLVAVDTFNPAGRRLIDGRLPNVVLVLMLTTAILAPVLTEHFAPRMLSRATPAKAA
jgi:hypothetical protein